MRNEFELTKVALVAMSSSEQIVVREWSASFRWIQTHVGLVISKLELEGTKTEIEVDPFALTLAKPAEWVAVVEEGAVQMFVESRIPDGIKEVRVTIGPKAIHVTAKVKVLVEIEVVADCNLRLHEGRQIFVDVVGVSVGGTAIKSLVQQQLDKVNPILDADDLPLSLKFERVELVDGEIHVFGNAEP